MAQTNRKQRFRSKQWYRACLTGKIVFAWRTCNLSSGQETDGKEDGKEEEEDDDDDQQR